MLGPLVLYAFLVIVFSCSESAPVKKPECPILTEILLPHRRSFFQIFFLVFLFFCSRSRNSDRINEELLVCVGILLELK